MARGRVLLQQLQAAAVAEAARAAHPGRVAQPARPAVPAAAVVGPLHACAESLACAASCAAYQPLGPAGGGGGDQMEPAGVRDGGGVAGRLAPGCVGAAAVR